jgi:hypothetical protein
MNEGKQGNPTKSTNRQSPVTCRQPTKIDYRYKTGTNPLTTTYLSHIWPATPYRGLELLCNSSENFELCRRHWSTAQSSVLTRITPIHCLPGSKLVSIIGLEQIFHINSIFFIGKGKTDWLKSHHHPLPLGSNHNINTSVYNWSTRKSRQLFLIPKTEYPYRILSYRLNNYS